VYIIFSALGGRFRRNTEIRTFACARAAGWRGDRTARLQQLIVEYGLAGTPIEAVFDLFVYNEGRDPAAERPWLRV
jgi:hypothetical protein